MEPVSRASAAAVNSGNASEHDGRYWGDKVEVRLNGVFEPRERHANREHGDSRSCPGLVWESTSARKRYGRAPHNRMRGPLSRIRCHNDGREAGNPGLVQVRPEWLESIGDSRDLRDGHSRNPSGEHRDEVGGNRDEGAPPFWRESYGGRSDFGPGSTPERMPR